MVRPGLVLRRSTFLVGLGVALALSGCGSGSSLKNVQIHVTGPSGMKLQGTLTLPGQPLGRGTITLPYSITALHYKPGTFVSYSVATIQQNPSIVTCELTSGSRVVSTASASNGATATCSGQV